MPYRRKHSTAWKPYVPSTTHKSIQLKVSLTTICLDSWCQKTPRKGSKWCDEHGCKVALCSEAYNCPLHTCTISYCRHPRQDNTTRFCRDHRCVSSSCSESKYDCPVHVCADQHCSQQRVHGSQWCMYCKCPVKSCREDKFCTLHVCAVKSAYNRCQNLHIEGGRFCVDHTCRADGCSNGGPVCHEHQCMYDHCTRLIVKGMYCTYHACLDPVCVQSRRCILHMCKCLYKQRHDESVYCIDCKCRWCNDHRSCTFHKCHVCRKNTYTNHDTQLCTSCTCIVWNCSYAKVHDGRCRMHTPRCMECEDVAVVRKVYCKTHGKCSICRHKVCRPGQSTCGRHHHAVVRQPWAYPLRTETTRTFHEMIGPLLRDIFTRSRVKNCRLHDVPLEVFGEILKLLGI